MGKKKGKDKKGKGAEKTVQKTEKNMEKKVKKLLKETGEDDIEAMIAEFQEKDRVQQQVIEMKCNAPSPRCNMTLTPHPERDELIMFGGEFFNGNKTFLYNDLLIYNLKSCDWTLVKCPNSPPPRCAHQAVALHQGGGQMWVFGGEYASPTQTQFYHYKDLWLLHLKDKRWEKINAPGGPTARSGHRMAACKKLLLVFGGFHDNTRDYKYFNDIHAFNLETYTWLKLEISGIPPAPRSGCILGASQDQNSIVIYGGYSKEKLKRDVDKGKTHTDMYMLEVDGKLKQESTPKCWKWKIIRQSGYRPSPRCGCSMTTVPGNRGVVFGGVHDEEEDEENVKGVFFNDNYSLELDTGKWHEVLLKKKKDATEKKKRRKVKEEGDEDAKVNDIENSDNSDNSDEEEEMEEAIDSLQVDDLPASSIEPELTETVPAKTEDLACTTNSACCTDDIFTVSIGAQSAQSSDPFSHGSSSTERLFKPCPRSNPMLAVKNGILYLYGGFYEVADRQYTLSDFYSLDLHKLDKWNTLIHCDMSALEWQDSGSSSEDEEEEDMDDDEEDSDDDDDEDDDEDMEEEVPDAKLGETLDEFFGRTMQYWTNRAELVAKEEGIEATAKQMRKAAQRMAKDHFQLSQ